MTDTVDARRDLERNDVCGSDQTGNGQLGAERDPTVPPLEMLLGDFYRFENLLTAQEQRVVARAEAKSFTRSVGE